MANAASATATRYINATSPAFIRTDRHSEDGESKMVVFRDPERSVLVAREHRRRGKPPFAGPPGLNVDPSWLHSCQHMPWHRPCLAACQGKRRESPMLVHFLPFAALRSEERRVGKAC